MKVLHQYLDLNVFSDTGSQLSYEDLLTPNILSKQYHILKKKEGRKKVKNIFFFELSSNHNSLKHRPMSSLSTGKCDTQD